MTNETFDGRLDNEEHLMVRAAWLSYVEGLTQSQIAKRLGLHRIRVNRLLAQARAQGIVQIRINSKLANCVALENDLRKRWDLEQVVVVPSSGDAIPSPHAVAAAAGAVLSDHITDGKSIGMGWGRTLQMSLRSISVHPVSRLSVVSLLGGLTRGSILNAYEAASRLADMFDAECFHIAAPIFADSEVARDLFMRQPILEDAFAHARGVDVAYISVGALGPHATNSRLGLISDADIESLRKAGAVGDICAHWVDADGHIVDHALNRRVIAVHPDDLRRVGTVILVSGGIDKVAPLLAVLKKGIVDILVTDERAAEGILTSAK